MSTFTEDMVLPDVSRPRSDSSGIDLHFRADGRKIKAKTFEVFCWSSTGIAIAVLSFLLLQIFTQGIGWLNWEFITSFPSRFAEEAGVKSALFGSMWLLVFTALFAVPLGVGAAVYLEEIMPNNSLRRFIDINISNLAGVPAIVYGILGLTIFVRFLMLDRSILAGAMTLGTMILPVIIIASQEALKGVPVSIRHAAFAVGASRWQTIHHHILPAATPGILTGVILAISRAIGEAAPLILIGGVTYIAFVPEGPMDSFTALPIQIFNWASRPQAEFQNVAAAGIMVLLALLISANSLAIFIRYRAERNNLCRNL